MSALLKSKIFTKMKKKKKLEQNNNSCHRYITKERFIFSFDLFYLVLCTTHLNVTEQWVTSLYIFNNISKI